MCNLILITGDDSLAVKNNAAKIAETEKAKLADSFSFEVISGDNEATKPEKILEDLLISISTPSFFGSTKTIWLKHFDHFKLLTGKTKANTNFQEFFKTITDMFKDISDNSLKLIIDGGNLDKRTSFYKFCSANGKVYESKKVQTSDKAYQANLRQKIKSLCEEEELDIAYNAIEFLIESVGSDTGRLTTEVQKLASYVGNSKRVTLNDCHAICTKTIEMAQWIFAESLANRDMKESFYSLNILIDNLISEKKSGSAPELTMFFSALRKFQEILKVKRAAAEFSFPERVSYNNFKDILSSNREVENNYLLTLHPYRAYMLHQQACKFFDNEIVTIFKELLDANRELVSGNSTPRIILENLILHVCRN